jgi:hypothetical protein
LVSAHGISAFLARTGATYSVRRDAVLPCSVVMSRPISILTIDSCLDDGFTLAYSWVFAIHYHAR